MHAPPARLAARGGRQAARSAPRRPQMGAWAVPPGREWGSLPLGRPAQNPSPARTARGSCTFFSRWQVSAAGALASKGAAVAPKIYTLKPGLPAAILEVFHSEPGAGLFAREETARFFRGHNDPDKQALIIVNYMLWKHDSDVLLKEQNEKLVRARRPLLQGVISVGTLNGASHADNDYDQLCSVRSPVTGSPYFVYHGARRRNDARILLHPDIYAA